MNLSFLIRPRLSSIFPNSGGGTKEFCSKNFKLLDQPPCHDQDW
jgi:hypothetical protein